MGECGQARPPFCLRETRAYQWKLGAAANGIEGDSRVDEAAGTAGAPSPLPRSEPGMANLELRTAGRSFGVAREAEPGDVIKGKSHTGN